MADDALLLAQWTKTGDAAAFSELARRHAGLVYGTCRRIVGDHHCAEDVAQECLLELARKAGLVRTSVAGFLHTLATSRARNRLRQDNARERREAIAGTDMREVAEVEPKWSELLPLIDDALASLPDEERLPIILHFFEGRVLVDIADELHCGKSTIARRITHGIEVMREKLRLGGAVTTSIALSAMLSANAAETAPPTLLIAASKMALGIGRGAMSPALTVKSAAASALFKASIAIAAALCAGAAMTGYYLGSRSPMTTTSMIIAKLAPPTGTWAQLSNTSLWPALPLEATTDLRGTGQPELWNPHGKFSYSGGDLATIDGHLGFCFWGGGGTGTPDNSLYFAPFDGTGARRLSGPYLAPDGSYAKVEKSETHPSISRNAPSSVTAAGAPLGRDTYSSVLAIEVEGKPAFWCFGGWLSSGTSCNATRLFDLTLTYAQAMARPDMGWALKAPAPRSALASASGWDPVRKRVVVRCGNFIGAYYPDQDRWELWEMQAPFGSDVAASVAMDIAGRRMYVLGDGIAEVIDLDSKAWRSLSDKPWAENFVKKSSQGGYPTAPGVSWHARSKRIVIWVGGQNLILIDPSTDTQQTVSMTGATVTAASLTGTYGRFRTIPGTDLVVLVNDVDQNIFIGTIP